MPILPHTPRPVAPDLTGTALPDGVAPLSSPHSPWALLRVQGADATRFLHSQLTNDFALAKPGNARLAAFCNAKGRMQASFVALRTTSGSTPHAEGDTWLLLCRRDLIEAAIKRLRLFVLRSKVTLDDASAQFAVYGLLGAAAQAAWQGDVPAAPWQHQVQPLPTGARHLVSLYPAAEQDGAVPRALCVQDKSMPAPTGQPLDEAAWELAEVRSGVATISQATWEAFVPQMLNYESVGGVNFKKGCYPGQEVVARSQFRGAIKRRACIASGRLAAGAALPLAGHEVWQIALDTANETHATAPEPCGLVAQVAPTSQGFELIAAIQISACEAAARGHAMLRVGGVEGIEVILLPLPYPLLQDI